MTAVPVGVKQCVPVALACISLTPGDADHPSISFTGHLCIFFGEMSIICNDAVSMLLCKSPLCILDTRPLEDLLFANILYHYLGLLYSLLRLPFHSQKVFVLIKSNFSVFFFFCLLYNSHSIKYHIKGMRFIPMFSSKMVPFYVLNLGPCSIISFSFM